VILSLTLKGLFLQGEFMNRKNSVRYRCITVISLAAVSLFLLPLASRAQWLIPPATTNLMNFNFDADASGTYGGAPPKMYPNVYPSVGAGNNSTVTIGTVPGMSGKAVILTATANNSVLDYSYLDQYPADGATPTVYGKHGVYVFDICQIANSLSAGPAYGGDSTAVEGYISGEGWIWGFALDATSATGGNFLLETAPNGSVGPIIGAFTTGTVYRVQIDNDYIAGTYDVSIDGNLVASQVSFDAGPYINSPRSSWGTNAQIKEIFAYNVSSGTGDLNVTAFDNIHYYLEVPEASPTLLMAMGVIIIGVITRRGHRGAN